MEPIRNDICTDFVQVITGIPNRLSSAYMEAANTVEKDNDAALGYLKNFIASIENIRSRRNAIDPKISASKGNINSFVSYENIEKGLKFITTNKTPSGATITKDLVTVHDALVKYKTYYTSGYSHNNRLLMLEYESAMYLLITGLAMALSFCFEVTDKAGTTKVVPKAKAYFGITGKKLHEFAEILSGKDHAKYLDELDKAGSGAKSEPVSESVYTESGILGIVTTTVNLISSIWGAGKSVVQFGVHTFKTAKKTVFGIVPLIRGVIYLSYKRKANSILALEENIQYIEQNINILQNKQGMSQEQKDAIIKKQKASIEKYRKKAEKLRAQLEEGEKDAASAIKAEDTQIGTPASVSDDDFVLESVLSENRIKSLYDEIVESSSRSYDQVLAKRKSHDIVGKVVGPDKKPIGFAFGWFKKKDKDTKQQEPEKPSVDKETLNKIYAEFKSKYSRDSIRLSLTKVNDDLSSTASKIGGHGFWPAGKTYPDKMALLIQINFAEFPHIDDFPAKGILQVFIDANDAFKGKIFYHENITNPIDVSDKPTIKDYPDSPTNSIYSLKGTKVSQCPCCWYNDEMNELFIPIFNKHVGTNLKNLYELGKMYSKETWDSLYDIYVSNSESWGTRIGGYPNFTQNDVRDGHGDQMDRLIVQIDSEEGIMFGDCGIANVFIPYADMKAKRFEKAFFTWDCY